MGLHGATRPRRIVALDGFEYAPVVILPALRAAADTENAQALFAQQTYDGIDQR